MGSEPLGSEEKRRQLDSEGYTVLDRILDDDALAAGS